MKVWNKFGLHYNNKGLKLCLPFVPLLINNLEQKLYIIENVGMKYPGPFSVESAKICFSQLSFKQRDDHMCYIIKYSVTVLVLNDKWNQELEQTNGAESSRT